MSDLSPLHHATAAARPGPRPVRAPHGSTLHCANWLIEAAWRMLQNNLDPEVAENPDALVVYGGIGKAARNWECFEAILDSLRKLKEDQTLLIVEAMKTMNPIPAPKAGRIVQIFVADARPVEYGEVLMIIE